MGLIFVSTELIACACLRLITYEIATVRNLFGEGSALVNSQFVVTAMFVHWSVDKQFRFVFRSWPYFWFDMKNSDKMLITYSSS